MLAKLLPVYGYACFTYLGPTPKNSKYPVCAAPPKEAKSSTVLVFVADSFARKKKTRQ